MVYDFTRVFYHIHFDLYHCAVKNVIYETNVYVRNRLRCFLEGKEIRSFSNQVYLHELPENWFQTAWPVVSADGFMFQF